MKTFLKILMVLSYIPSFIIAGVMALIIAFYWMYIEFTWVTGKEWALDIIEKTAEINTKNEGV